MDIVGDAVSKPEHQIAFDELCKRIAREADRGFAAAIERLEEENTISNAAIVERDQRIVDNEKQISELKRQLAERNRQLSERDQQISQLKAESSGLQARVSAVTQKLEKSEAGTSDLRTENKRIQHEVQVIKENRDTVKRALEKVRSLPKIGSDGWT